MATNAVERSSRDIPVLAEFVSIWCDDHCQDRARRRWRPPRVVEHLVADPPLLCEDCQHLLGYSVGRRLLCPHDPKPACKHCPTRCYREDDRARMRAVMRYSGWRLLLRGRWWLLGKYFF